MTRILGSFVLAAALLGSTFVSAPDAQTQIQRGYGPTISAGSGGAIAGIASRLTTCSTACTGGGVIANTQTGANTTETDLFTYSLPAGTLSANNYSVRVKSYGTTAANGNVKNLRLYFGATVVIFDNTTTSGADWMVSGEVTRTGASAQTAHGLALFLRTWLSDVTAPAADTTGAITIRVTGQNGTAAAGDIVGAFFAVDFLRPA